MAIGGRRKPVESFVGVKEVKFPSEGGERLYGLVLACYDRVTFVLVSNSDLFSLTSEFVRHLYVQILSLRTPKSRTFQRQRSQSK